MAKKIHSIDITPSFKFAASVYLAVMASNKVGSEAHTNAYEGIMEMAAVIDRINKKSLLKDGTTQEELSKD